MTTPEPYFPDLAEIDELLSAVSSLDPASQPVTRFDRADQALVDVRTEVTNALTNDEVSNDLRKDLEAHLERIELAIEGNAARRRVAKDRPSDRLPTD